MRQELQSSAMSRSDYLLQKSTNPPKYSMLDTLNEILIDDDQVDRYKQLDPRKAELLYLGPYTLTLPH